MKRMKSVAGIAEIGDNINAVSVLVQNKRGTTTLERDTFDENNITMSPRKWRAS
jgi:hypothetical protein